MGNLLIYQSSAGSGKTYTLAKEYLKLAFRYPGAYRHILAVTFTNKATAEMKNRIIDFLIALTENKDEGLKSQLIKEGVKVDIQTQSKIVLDNILHDYSNFSVSTNDSFFNKVLRSFSKELKIQLGYQVDFDNIAALDSAIDKFFNEVGRNELLEKFMEDYIFSTMDDDKSWDVEKQIKTLGNEIFKERYWEKKLENKTGMQGLNINITNQGISNERFTDIYDKRDSIDDFKNELNIILIDFENKMKCFGDEAEKIIKKYSLETGDFLQTAKGVMNYLINSIRQNKTYNPNDNSYIMNAYKDESNWYKQKSEKKTIIQQALNDGLFDLLKQAVDYYNTVGIKYNTALEIKKTIYTVGIFEDLARLLNDYRRDNRFLLQSDISTILQTLISKEDSPFIFEKIGNNYRNFLIDEFQDTSNFHWKNFLPLIVNSLSEKNTSLIVGDVKQSIYRWRGGNMKLLLNKIYEDLNDFKELIETKNLNINRRSRKEIVEFNNIFFENAPSILVKGIDDSKYEDLINNSYKKAKQEVDKDKAGGYVNISYMQKGDEEELTIEDKIKVKLLDTIKSNLDDEYKLRDILILVRQNAEAGKIAGWLSEKGYDFVSSESLLLENSHKVRLIVNTLKYITDNKNDIARILMMLNYLKTIEDSVTTLEHCNKKEEGIFSVPKDDIRNEVEEYFYFPKSRQVGIKSKERLEFRNEEEAFPHLSEIFSKEKNREIFLNKLPVDFFKENEKPKLKPVLNDLTVFELTEQLIKIFKLDDNPNPYIIKFQDVILEYSQKGNTDLISFLNYWNDYKDKFSIIMPEEINAIRIMTIHSAKGLQSRVVIVPFANWNLEIDGKKDLIWVSSGVEPFNRASAYLVKATLSLEKSYFKDDFLDESVLTKLDNLNLLYVAFTRPEERLYIIVPEAEKNRVSSLIREIIENTDLLKGFLHGDNFEFGEKAKASQKEKKSELKSGHLKKYISCDWYKKITIKPKHRKLKVLTDKEFAFKTNWGNIVHEALSYIKTAQDVNDALHKIYFDGLITSEQRGPLEQKINKLLSDERIQKWFSGKANIITETDILLKDGKILRPDRIIIEGERATVIDYKTGIEKEEHIKQVNQYADVLMQMGYKNIDKYILYINESESNYMLKEVM